MTKVSRDTLLQLLIMYANRLVDELCGTDVPCRRAVYMCLSSAHEFVRKMVRQDAKMDVTAFSRLVEWIRNCTKNYLKSMLGRAP